MDKLAYNQVIGNESMNLQYSTIDTNIDLNSYTSPSAGNHKVTENAGWGEPRFMKYIRFISNGSNKNAANHTSQIKVKFTDGSIVTYVDAPTGTATSHVSGLGSLAGSGDTAHYDGGNATINFGEIKSVSAIFLRRYYPDGRIYYGQKVEYSTDGETWNTYWDSGNTGSYGNDDQTGLYAETAAGRTFTLGGSNIKGVRFAMTMTETSNGGKQNFIKGLDADSTGTGSAMGVVYYVANNSFRLTNAASVTNDSYVMLTNQTVYLEAGKTYKMRFNSTLVSGTVRGTQIQVFFGINKKYTETNSLRFNGAQNVWKEFSVTTTGTYNIRLDYDVTYTAGGVVNITNFEIVEA